LEVGTPLIRVNSATGQTKQKKIHDPAPRFRRKNCIRRRLWLHPIVPNAADSPLRRRLTVIYSGHVQGVGFRYTAKSVATGFDITGIIRNLSDGRVELVAEGRPGNWTPFAPPFATQVLLDLFATSR
jgi:hypothetical protein